MATTEHTIIESSCPCGRGTIAVTRSEPDHGYVRPNQIAYSAKIACGECAERYEIRSREYDRYPWVVRRPDADRQREAAERLAALEAEVLASEAVGRLRERIVAAVDGQPSMAAAHRVLRRFGLVRVTYSAYCKGPYGGEESPALRWRPCTRADWRHGGHGAGGHARVRGLGAPTGTHGRGSAEARARTGADGRHVAAGLGSELQPVRE